MKISKIFSIILAALWAVLALVAPALNYQVTFMEYFLVVANIAVHVLLFISVFGRKGKLEKISVAAKFTLCFGTLLGNSLMGYYMRQTSFMASFLVIAALATLGKWVMWLFARENRKLAFAVLGISALMTIVPVVVMGNNASQLSYSYSYSYSYYYYSYSGLQMAYIVLREIALICYHLSVGLVALTMLLGRKKPAADSEEYETPYTGQ